MSFTIEFVTLISIKCLLNSRFLYRAQLISIHISDIIALKADPLLGKVDDVLLGGIGISILVPKDLGVKSTVKRFDLNILFYVPSQEAIWSLWLSNYDNHFVFFATSTDLLDLGLFFHGINIEPKATHFTCCLNLLYVEIPDLIVIPKIQMQFVHWKPIKSVIKFFIMTGQKQKFLKTFINLILLDFWVALLLLDWLFDNINPRCIILVRPHFLTNLTFFFFPYILFINQ